MIRLETTINRAAHSNGGVEARYMTPRIFQVMSSCMGILWVARSTSCVVPADRWRIEGLLIRVRGFPETQCVCVNRGFYTWRKLPPTRCLVTGKTSDGSRDKIKQ